MKSLTTVSLAMPVILLSLSILVACYPQASPTATIIQSTKPAGTIAPDVEYSSVTQSYRTASTLQQLVAESAVIVVGDTTTTGETINLARNPNDPTQPDLKNLVVGQVYRVTVKRYLKGSGTNSINVVQPEAYLFERTPKTPENIEKARAKDNHIPLRPGITYLFFLNLMEKEFPGQNYFTGDRHPWRFVLPATGNAQPESPWSGAAHVFLPRPSADLISEVEFWINGGKLPTPANLTPLPIRVTPTRRPYP